MTVAQEAVLDALKQVYDPEIPVDIVNLGLVYEVAVAGSTVRVRMTTTSPGCPIGEYLALAVEGAVRRLEGVERVCVELVDDPPWGPERISEEGRWALGIG